MRIGLISDLHGNVSALEAVLDELAGESLDELVCLGDLAVGPQPAETIERVRRLGCPIVQGNWDEWFADGIPALRGEHGRRLVDQGTWWAKQLTPTDLEYLGALPATLELSLGGVELLCFHGSPGSNMAVLLPETSDEELAGALGKQNASVLAGGHTHIQLARPYGGSLLVNPGSVGLPFERWPPSDSRVLPWAEYAVLDSSDGQVSVDLRRTSYDVGQVLRSVLASEVPHARWWVDCWALQG